jgi:hypothetical protein
MTMIPLHRKRNRRRREPYYIIPGDCRSPMFPWGWILFYIVMTSAVVNLLYDLYDFLSQ